MKTVKLLGLGVALTSFGVAHAGGSFLTPGQKSQAESLTQEEQNFSQSRENQDNVSAPKKVVACVNSSGGTDLTCRFWIAQSQDGELKAFGSAGHWTDRYMEPVTVKESKTKDKKNHLQVEFADAEGSEPTFHLAVELSVNNKIKGYPGALLKVTGMGAYGIICADWPLTCAIDPEYLKSIGAR